MFLRFAGRRLVELCRMGYNGTRVERSWRRVVSGGVQWCSEWGGLAYSGLCEGCSE